jgi:hypothetical protein
VPQQGASFCTKCGTALVDTDKHQQLGDLEEYKVLMNNRCKEFQAAAERIEIIAPKPLDPEPQLVIKQSLP